MSQERFLQYSMVKENGERNNAPSYVNVTRSSRPGFGLRTASRAAVSESGSWLGDARPAASEIGVTWSPTEEAVNPFKILFKFMSFLK